MAFDPNIRTLFKFSYETMLYIGTQLPKFHFATSYRYKIIDK